MLGTGPISARLGGLILLIALTVAAGTEAGGREHASRDQDEIRRAVERGEIRPLTDLLAIVRSKLPGDITGVEIERQNGQWIYEFHVVDSKGRLVDVHVDARTGDIGEIREK
ncbi:PepSY domain-containing protein [Bradyrhizobium sp. WD16]|uniref:PepSY domain-containing protein n=1 Tax=Bradyrhizobium sp. WD16 TaxID=1521768 RepID=UPI0020A3D57B|nr:PepSY domain-containing protein [Bradyrhizobium sp. WD16]UTD29384.1 peptidase [Bradyrhizobium sp. WD16]